jgi:hypothetical protein
MEKTKKGFLLHAFKSKEIDYVKLAICCALSIKTNLKNNNIAVLMDKGTKSWLYKSIPEKIIDIAFDEIIISQETFQVSKRKHFDTPWTQFKADFNNRSRFLSYKYSPYDETIILDTDYIVMNDMFDFVWNNREDLLINKKVVDLKNNEFENIEDLRLGDHGIPLYWATVVYFKKSPFSKAFFDLVDYIREEYNFFQFLYGFKPSFYRNDFSFSIAVHMMNGYIQNGIKSFTDDTILTSYQKDCIADVISSNEILFLSHNVDEPWKNTLVNINDRNVHIMNKRELLRLSDKFIELCMEKL